MHAEHDEFDVLGRARGGDERAFLALYRAAHPGLLRYLSIIVGRAADEVASQTWIEVSRDLASFSGTLDDFRSWVAAVGRRRAVEYLEAVEPSARPGPVTTVDLTDVGPGAAPRTARALRVIADLPPREAEAVLLRSVMGLDDEGAASVLGVRRSTLRRAAVRGLQALGRRLESAAAHPDEATPDVLEVLDDVPARTLRVVRGPRAAGRAEARTEPISLPDDGQGRGVS